MTRRRELGKTRRGICHVSSNQFLRPGSSSSNLRVALDVGGFPEIPMDLIREQDNSMIDRFAV